MKIGDRQIDDVTVANNKLKGLEIMATIVMGFIWVGLAGLLLSSLNAAGIEGRQALPEKYVIDICMATVLIIGGIGLLIHFSSKKSFADGVKWSYLMLSTLVGYFASKSGVGCLIFALIITNGIAGKYLSIKARLTENIVKIK